MVWLEKNNLLNLFAQSDLFDVETCKVFLENNLSHGSAMWNLTIYQLIFSADNLDVYIKICITTYCNGLKFP